MMVLCTLFVLASALCKIQGVQKKMSRSFCLTYPVIYILESWDIIHWKGGIHSFVWSTKTFLYDILKCILSPVNKKKRQELIRFYIIDINQAESKNKFSCLRILTCNDCDKTVLILS